MRLPPRVQKNRAPKNQGGRAQKKWFFGMILASIVTPVLASPFVTLVSEPEPSADLARSIEIKQAFLEGLSDLPPMVLVENGPDGEIVLSLSPDVQPRSWVLSSDRESMVLGSEARVILPRDEDEGYRVEGTPWVYTYKTHLLSDPTGDIKDAETASPYR